MAIKRGKNLLGLNIGSSSVKIAELKETKKGFQLLNYGKMPLPPEAIVDGALMNGTVIVDAITELVNQKKVKLKEVATSISGHSVIIKKISLPVMSEDELEESIQWEAEQYIPFDINDVNIDVQILSDKKDDSGQMDVLLVAAKRDMINDYTQVITEAGLNPCVVDVDAFALQNMFEVNYEVVPGETVVLCDIGASIININVLRNGVTAFTRDISIGGNQYTEEIQKQINVSYEEAEALKIGGDLSGSDSEAVVPQEVEGIISSVSANLANDIQRSLDFYSATSTEDQISKIYLCGGSAKVPGLTKVIEEKVGIPVEILNPFRNVEFNEKVFDSAYIRQEGPSAAVAIGLALRKMGDK